MLGNIKKSQLEFLKKEWLAKEAHKKELILKEQKDKERLLQKEVIYTIPLNIFQCWHSDELPESVKESMENIKNNNPEFSHHLYNDKTCRDFIKSNFEEDVLYAYDSLIPHALRIDLWRYCILYKYGGIYLDIKYHCINDFKFIYLVDQEYLCNDLKESGLGIYNAILICKASSPLLLDCIKKVVENVKHEFYGKNGLEISGPLMIKPLLKDYDYKINLFHTYKPIDKTNFYYICYHTFPILQIHPNYRNEQKQKGEYWYEHYDRRNIYAKKYPIFNYHECNSYFFRLYEKCVISDVIRKGLVWEDHLHKVFERYIKPDFICLEAGCHIGTHTLKIATLCNQLYAFEPLPTSNQLLDYNLRTNQIKNTILSGYGLSDKPGNTTYGWSMEGNPGASGLNNNPMGNPDVTISTNIEVTLVTLDSLNLDRLDFIKLDVEGYEPLVIKGGMETIQKFKPIITLESWSSHKGEISIEDTKDRFKMLLDIGYDLIQISGPDFLFLPDTMPFQTTE